MHESCLILEGDYHLSMCHLHIKARLFKHVLKPSHLDQIDFKKDITNLISNIILILLQLIEKHSFER